MGVLDAGEVVYDGHEVEIQQLRAERDRYKELLEQSIELNGRACIDLAEDGTAERWLDEALTIEGWARDAGAFS